MVEGDLPYLQRGEGEEEQRHDYKRMTTRERQRRNVDSAVVET